MRLVYQIIDKRDGNDHELQVYALRDGRFEVHEIAYHESGASVETYTVQLPADVEAVIKVWITG